MAKVSFRLVMPEREVLATEADMVVVPGSEGDFGNTNFSSNVADLVAAAAWLRENHAAPKILVGHSLGGAAALASK